MPRFAQMRFWLSHCIIVGFSEQARQVLQLAMGSPHPYGLRSLDPGDPDYIGKRWETSIVTTPTTKAPFELANCPFIRA